MRSIILCVLAFFAVFAAEQACAQGPEQLLLKNYRPVSIYKIPVSHIQKAKYTVIDMHTHAYAKSPEDLKRWVGIMDRCNISKSVIQTYATGAKFDSIYKVYSQYGDRFEVWCGFDYTGCPQKGWSEKAVKELERCFAVGARGVGELGDKGWGEYYSSPVAACGMHVDDIAMAPLFRKCAELHIPVSIHVAEPMWMYEPMDSTNDGLMNAYQWRMAGHPEKKIGHAELIRTLENVARNNPATNFIACHYANCEYDLQILGRLFDLYTNLYADISARYGETATIPRYMKAFFEMYPDKLVYGTDMKFSPDMYAFTFRVLESSDEHFYATAVTGYHWPLQGFGLSDQILEKLYNVNAAKILHVKNP